MKNLWVGIAALPPIIVFAFATFAIGAHLAAPENTDAESGRVHRGGGKPGDPRRDLVRARTDEDTATQAAGRTCR